MSAPDLALKRILCVDNNADSCDLLITMLSDYEVIPTGTVSEGLRLARSDRFDLVILEQRLPDGQGTDLCRLIHDFMPRTPILFFSCAAYAADRRDGLAAGAQEYLVKPDDLATLEPNITRLIRHSEAGGVG